MFTQTNNYQKPNSHARTHKTRTHARTREHTHTHTHTGLLRDLCRFDPSSLGWSPVLATANGDDPPDPRRCHGFAAAGADLYVFGGQGASGGAACVSM